MALALALAPRAEAQESQCNGTEGVDFQRVTVREINAIPQDNVDYLNANEATLTTDEIRTRLTNDLEGEVVEFTAVVLSNPFLSGQRSLVTNGDIVVPGGIHFFVRDTTAASAGYEGMGIQIADETANGDVYNYFVGDIITICGRVAPYVGGRAGKSMQIGGRNNPVSYTHVGSVENGDPLLDPITITTEVVHDIVSDKTQIDWSVYSDYNGQFVRFEEIELIQGLVNSTGTQVGRSNLLLSSFGDETQINSYDTSVCFRNDRDSTYYPGSLEPPSCIDTPFAPPPSGIVNIQGFLVYQGYDFGDYSFPSPANFVIVPFEDEDFEIAVAPPIVTLEDTGLATPDGAVVRATVVPGTTGNTVASVVADYETSSGGEGQIALTNTSGDVYEGTITGLTVGEFVTYRITATDNQGAATPLGTPVTRRVVDGPISSIFDVQVTADGGQGRSGVTTAEPVAFDLDATVQSVFFDGAVVTIQDDPSLGAFSGVWVDFEEATTLAVGDQITITEARVEEDFDVTTLFDVTYEVTGSGDALGYKEVTTDLFNGTDGAATAEQHEGMLLTFTDVTIAATNADAPSGPFGEFLISSDGTVGNALRVDDLSTEISYEGQDPGTVYAEGNTLSYVRGPLYYSFGNYKLTPATTGDIGELIVALEGDLEAASARIVGSYPNPAVGAARVRFELASAGDVSLRVFDAMGRQVAVVAEGAFSAGVHDATADLGGLAAGVYVVRLDAEGAVATARLAVVR